MTIGHFTISNVNIISINSTYDVYGLIDTNLTTKYTGLVVYQTQSNIKHSKTTHGDKMVNFIKKIAPNSNIYYYDATDENGEIKTKNIIDGLEWMINNNIKKVNISLSSKEYNETLETWLKVHRDNIQVFASYNNQLNTFDYPAMYDYVIGSGNGKKIFYKDIDQIYKSDLILINKKLKLYRGNSYLSIVTMVSN